MKLPKEIFEQHIAVLGKTGSGKTSTAKLFVEQVVADGARVCVLDPIKSDWWGLTSSADGKKAGLPFHILGGPQGHVPLHESAGKAIGEVVANGALPLSIIDMADFRMGGLQNFFCDFAESLLKKNRGHVYLVLEEAHEFAPKEMAGVKGENMGVYWAKKLATAGRSKGLRLVLLTQRTQALHNALLGSCETMIVHRMTAPADQKPAIDWLKANASKEVASEVAGSLSALKTGEGWLCSGEAQLFERIKFPRIKTFDNTSGQAHAKAVKTSPVDAEKLRSIIGAAVDEAKANDPSELKKQIADLKRQVAAKPAPAADPKAVERAVGAAVADRDRHWKGELLKAEKAHGSVVNRLTKIHQLSTLNGDATIAVEQPKIIGITPPKIVAPQLSYAAPKTSARTIRHDQSTDSGEFKFGKAEQSILRAFYWTRDEQSTPAKIGFYSGYSHKSGSFANTISRLRSAGLVEGWNITDAGSVMAAEYADAKPSGLELREWLRPKISKCENEILDTLMEAGGNRLSPEQIAAATPSQYSHGSGSFANALARLRSLEAAEGYGGQGVKAADVFFE